MRTQSLVKMKALPTLRERLWSENFGIVNQDFREQARQFCQLWLWQQPARNPQRLRPEPLGHGPIRMLVMGQKAFTPQLYHHPIQKG